MGTMALYTAAFHHSKESGSSREAAYREAITAIRHQRPVSQLTEEEMLRLIEVFALFENPRDPGVLLQHALKTEQIEFLREPYLSRMEEKANTM